MKHLTADMKAYHHNRYMANHEFNLQQSKDWYKANKERKLATCAAWRKANPDKQRRSQAKRLYGIEATDYDKMLLSQGGKCKLCLKLLTKPCIEHNHLTNEVRGLVCQGCNILISNYETAQRILPIGAIESYLGLKKDTNGN